MALADKLWGILYESNNLGKTAVTLPARIVMIR